MNEHETYNLILKRNEDEDTLKRMPRTSSTPQDITHMLVQAQKKSI
jgi:hypothetical protein